MQRVKLAHRTQDPTSEPYRVTNTFTNIAVPDCSLANPPVGCASIATECGTFYTYKGALFSRSGNVPIVCDQNLYVHFRVRLDPDDSLTFCLPVSLRLQARRLRPASDSFVT